jgi:DNA-binding transcriptional regulator YdaS (Cro superfamily)
MSRLQKKPPRQAGLKDKTKLLIKAAGGHRKLGRLLGISYQAIGQWDRVPAEWLIEIEILIGIPREELRPDLYNGFRRIKG